jgi:hypothetical protein
MRIEPDGHAELVQVQIVVPKLEDDGIPADCLRMILLHLAVDTNRREISGEI